MRISDWSSDVCSSDLTDDADQHRQRNDQQDARANRKVTQMLGHFRYRRAYRISDVGQRRITGPLLAREANKRRHRLQVSGLTPGGALMTIGRATCRERLRPYV